MALDDKQRRSRFSDYDAETKSMLMRTHTQRWLEKNRQRLSTSQVQLIQDMIRICRPRRTAIPAIRAIAKQGPRTDRRSSSASFGTRMSWPPSARTDRRRQQAG